MTSIGFTGTQKGLTKIQNEVLEVYLDMLITDAVMQSEFEGFHHGDCEGADYEACMIVAQLTDNIHTHPPLNGSKRAFWVTTGGTVYPAKEYLVRNKDIVNACTILVVCPETMEEKLRSGTWSTVRYAKKLNKQILIVYPDGSIRWTTK